MNVLVTIDGREAIPVRALPFAQSYYLTPKYIVGFFRYPETRPIFGTFCLGKLTAYALGEGTQPHSPLPPNQWDRTYTAVYALSDELDAEGLARPELRCDYPKRDYQYDQRVVSRLPAAVFVWRYEFEAAYGARKWKGDPPCFNPPISREEWALVMEGFERFLQSCPSEPPTLAAELAPEGDALTAVAELRQNPTKKKRLQTRLLEILDGLEQYARGTGEEFNRLQMPGLMPGKNGKAWEEVGSFHWLCAKLEEEFRMPYDTFEKYRRGICACKGFAKPCDFYVKALPVCRQFLKK